MKTIQLTKIIASTLVAASLFALNPIGASAQWRQDSKGWWYAQGSSWYKGWKYLDGKWYYFNSNGYMAHDTIIAGYKLGSDGAWIGDTSTASTTNMITTNKSNSQLSQVNSNNTLNSGVVSIDDVMARDVTNYDAVTIKKADEIIASVIKTGMTDFEKELALYNYVAAHTEYDYANYRSSTIPHDDYRAYGALINGIAVCQGYADAMCLLLNKAGIKCITVIGNVSGSGHAWNIVEIGRSCYHLDATFGDSLGIESSFNLTDNEAAFNHQWDKTKYPICNNEKYNYKNYIYCKDNGISLDDRTRTVSGTVSLPKGEVAEKDMSIKVFAHKTVYREDEDDVKVYDNYQCETSIIIPKGSNSTTYSLIVPAFEDGFAIYYDMLTSNDKYERNGAYKESEKTKMTNSTYGSLIDVSEKNKEINLRILKLGEIKYVDPLTLKLRGEE